VRQQRRESGSTTGHVEGITRPEVSVSVTSDKQRFADHAQILELQGISDWLRHHHPVMWSCITTNPSRQSKGTWYNAKHRAFILFLGVIDSIRTHMNHTI